MSKQPPRILYVDDDESACKMVDELLTIEGYAVKTMNEGDAALRLLQTENFDVVLLDIRMPGKDGLQVLSEMKEMKSSPRVIMITAVGDLSVALDAVRRGANDYLTKPYQIEALLSSIRRVLAR